MRRSRCTRKEHGRKAKKERMGERERERRIMVARQEIGCRGGWRIGGGWGGGGWGSKLQSKINQRKYSGALSNKGYSYLKNSKIS
jgi:hypothetical protein